MRAVVVRPPVPGVELTDVPSPALGKGMVLVNVLECGVCGTDHDIAEGRYGTVPAGQSYLILGHENLGEVANVAEGVDAFKPGELVVATVRRGCGICRFCLSNRSDFCETGLFTERGIRGRDGYLAESYADVPEYLVKVPPSLRSVAVLLEPLSVVEKAVLEGQRVLDRKEPTLGHSPSGPPTALVAGTGAIGMLASFVLRARGYDLTAIDRHGEGTSAASVLRSIGAHHSNAVDGLGVLGSEKFDLVLEASGSAPLDFDLLHTLGPNGVLVLTGIPDANVPPAAVAGGALLREVVLQNQAVVGSVNANRTFFEAGIRDLSLFQARWPGAVERMVTVRRPIADAPLVLERRSQGTIKTVLAVRPPGAV